MEMTSYPPGMPSWVDLGTSDVDAAVTFYSDLFGWSAPPADPNAGGYRMVVLRNRPVAGIGPLQMPNVPPCWTTYFSVADADETAAKVTKAGGQVFMAPMDVFEFGRMAVFADTLGAVFAVWQPKLHVGAGLVGEPGTFAWAELLSTDVEASERFYVAVFDWDVNDSPVPGTDYVRFELAGQPAAGLMKKPAGIPAEVPPYWGVYFSVANVDDTVAAAERLGGTVVAPAMDMPVGRFAVLADPQGAIFSIMSLNIDMMEN